MIYTIFKNKITNEEVIILEGNNENDLICGILEWDKNYTEHEHHKDDNYQASYDDGILKVWNKETLSGTYSLLHRLPNGKNIYKK